MRSSSSTLGVWVVILALLVAVQALAQTSGGSIGVGPRPSRPKQNAPNADIPGPPSSNIPPRTFGP